MCKKYPARYVKFHGSSKKYPREKDPFDDIINLILPAREHRNALAARGYWQAYRSARQSLRKVIEGDNPGAVGDDDHRDWYREMFGPSVTAGLLRTADLAGYRNDQVYIRRSMHVPPRYEAVRDCMPAFFR